MATVTLSNDLRARGPFRSSYTAWNQRRVLQKWKVCAVLMPFLYHRGFMHSSSTARLSLLLLAARVRCLFVIFCPSQTCRRTHNRQSPLGHRPCVCPERPTMRCRIAACHAPVVVMSSSLDLACNSNFCSHNVEMAYLRGLPCALRQECR